MSVTAAYTGKRRADVPVDSLTPQVAQQTLPPPASAAPEANVTYVPKRRAAVPCDAPAATSVPAVERLAAAPAIETYVDDLSPIELSSATLYELSESMRGLLDVETRTDIPRITLDLATDLSTEDTVEVPTFGKRSGSRGSRSRNRIKRRRISLSAAPALIGVAALVIAVSGTIHLSHDQIRSLVSTRLMAATALTGTSADSVSDRATVSRDSDRAVLTDDAEAQAENRVTALDQIDQQATAQGQWLADNIWVSPLPAGSWQVSAWWGDNTGAHEGQHHNGVDLAAPTGTPIYAVESGTILNSGWGGGSVDYGSYGNLVVEKLLDGTEVWYAHQSKIVAPEGAQVTKGQIIGYVGATGYATGPHLHIEVHPGGGDPVNPVPALEAHGVEVDPNHLDPRIP